MTSFETCRDIEVQGFADITSFIRDRSYEGRFVLTDKGRLAEFLQKTAGDAIMNLADGRVIGVEVKCEESNEWGNFFLETWSNLAFGRQKQGWMHTLITDVLLYYFIRQGELYSIPFQRLFEWAHGAPSQRRGPRLYAFPFKHQKKHQQKNLTAGHCVPINVIKQEVGLRQYQLIDGKFIDLEAPAEVEF